MQPELRKLPSVGDLLQSTELVTLINSYNHQIVADSIRVILDSSRKQILAGQPAPALATLKQMITQRIVEDMQPTLQPVINATGVINHTNLGRALLSKRAQQAMFRAASAYSNLEYTLETGKRGSRYIHATNLLCKLSGAEAAVVVNNNAGAVVLALTELALTADGKRAGFCSAAAKW